jgi:hypothetical protein
MTHHNPITEILGKLKRHPQNSDQPDLTKSELISNQRQLIKFWIEHSKKLEKENAELKAKLSLTEDSNLI